MQLMHPPSLKLQRVVGLRPTKKPLSRLVKAQVKLAVYINRNRLTNVRSFNIGAATFV